jgi:hypothetical protein
VQEFVRSDGCSYLTDEDRLRYDLAEQKWQNKQMARMLKEQELAKFTDKINVDIRALHAGERADLRGLLALRDELGQKYGVDFNSPGFTWDDDTGRMLQFETPEKPDSTGGVTDVERPAAREE